jgi:hypothetical protein
MLLKTIFAIDATIAATAELSAPPDKGRKNPLAFDRLK